MYKWTRQPDKALNQCRSVVSELALFSNKATPSGNAATLFLHLLCFSVLMLFDNLSNESRVYHTA